MGSTHAGHSPADKWPLMPRGGYQRAIPRDALTGEPIRPDTIHKRAYDPLDARDTGAHSPTKRGHLARTPRTQTRPTLATTHLPLPVLQLDGLTDDSADRAADTADADTQAGDTTADVEGQEVADGE